MVEFLKAHGTENDFIFLLDTGAQLSLTPEVIARLADRRAGIGGDGVIRVARAKTLCEQGVLAALPQGVVGEEWFMDYYNADGSIAEMCGNGVRAFVHVLAAQGLLGEVDFSGLTVGIGTRGGRKEVQILSADSQQAQIRVDMGSPRVLGLSTAQVGSLKLAGLAVDMGNPHLAAVIPNMDARRLGELPIDQPVVWDEEFFPQGVNLEVLTALQPVQGSVTQRSAAQGREAQNSATQENTEQGSATQENAAQREVFMRVHERGVGETRSCGTGTVAACVAALADSGEEVGSVLVHVPGGTVTVTITEETSYLEGPSRIVARGTTDLLSI